MANPQPDKYTRLSNELYESIMQTDFTKRQRSMLDLIIRASYGCNNKYALLRPSDFEVVGVYKTHVKKELEYLCRAKVITWHGERISLNKDYEQWRINLCKPCNGNKLQEILRRNISNEVTETVTKVTKTVTAEQMVGYQNSNQEVTKTVTDTPQESLQPSDSAGCLKTIKDNSSSSIVGEASLEDAVVFYQKHFPILNPYQYEQLVKFVDDGMAADVILYVMEKAALNGALKFAYIQSTLGTLFVQGVRTKEQALREEELFKRRGGFNNDDTKRPRASPRRGSAAQKRTGSLECIIINGAGDEAAEPG